MGIKVWGLYVQISTIRPRWEAPEVNINIKYLAFGIWANGYECVLRYAYISMVPAARDAVEPLLVHADAGDQTRVPNCTPRLPSTITIPIFQRTYICSGRMYDSFRTKNHDSTGILLG